MQRIAAELSRRGISKEICEEALTEMPATDETLDRLVRSKLRDPTDRDQLRKVSAAMVRRGFSWDEVRRSIERVGTEAEPED